MSQVTLRSVLKAIAASELEAVGQIEKIDNVVEGRKNRVLQIEAQVLELENELRELYLNKKTRLIAESRLGEVSRLFAYGKRLEAQIASLNKSAKERQTELERALERLAAAQDELKAVRVEKKKIERVIEQSEEKSATTAAAEEDSALDEAVTSRFKKK